MYAASPNLWGFFIFHSTLTPTPETPYTPTPNIREPYTT